MSTRKTLTLFGNCRHHWGKVDFAYNAPVPFDERPSIDAWVDRDASRELLHGFTVITQRCEHCGLARSYRTPGRTQA